MRRNTAFVVSEETGEKICAQCGRTARITRHKVRNQNQPHCDHCEYTRRIALHPPGPPKRRGRKPGIKPEPKPKKPRPEKRDPYQDWAGPWKVCHASFLAAIHAKSGSNASFTRYRGTLHDFFVSVDGKLPGEVTRTEIEAYLTRASQQLGREGRPTTESWNTRLSCLRSFMKYASEWPTIDAQGVTRPLLDRLSPCAGIRFQARGKPGYRSLSDDDLAAFFAVLDRDTPVGAQSRALFLAYFILGRRRQELLSLTWGAIQPATFHDGGVRRSGWLYSWYGKGKSRVLDTAEMPAIVYDALVHALKVSGRLDTIQADDYVFCALHHSYDPKRPMSSNNVWYRCKRTAILAGIDPAKICVHAFRHACAQSRFIHGQDIFSIKTLLRHSSLDMTAIYLSELAGTADNFQSQMAARYGDL